MHASESIMFEREVRSRNVGQLISKAIELNSQLNDKDPAHFRPQKNNTFVTTYNKIGVMLSNNYPAKDTDKLKRVDTHRQHVFGGDKERVMLSYIKTTIVYRMNFKMFKNGNYSAETNRFFSKILK